MIRVSAVLALYLGNMLFADGLFVIALTLPMLALVVAGMLRIKSDHFQIGDMFWFCMFIYFVISPLQRIHDGHIGGATSITAYAYDADEFVVAMLIVFLFTLPFLFVGMASRGNEIVKFSGHPNPITLITINVVGFVLFVMSEGDPERILSSRLEQDGFQPFIGSLFFLAAQSITACLIASNFRTSKRKIAPALALLLAIVLLAVSRNPFNAPRFTLLAAWGPVLLALMGGRLSAAKFYIGCIVALTTVFPILNITTRVGFEGLSNLDDISILDNFFDIPSVDVFDTTVHAVRYMSMHDWTGGGKLVAVILFFVPRSLWVSKPVVGGLDIGNELFNAGMYGTPNLSFFLGSDFYMDFGLAGVAFGGVLAAVLMSLIVKSRSGDFCGHRILHFVLVASLPILLRGPVGAVLPIFVCQVFLLVVFSRFWRPQEHAARDAGQTVTAGAG